MRFFHKKTLYFGKKNFKKVLKFIEKFDRIE